MTDLLAALREVFPPTPLQRNAHLSAKYDADIWLKREDLTPVRSYKIRGAMAAMRRLAADPRAPDRVVCASAGNHAQGVAYTCAATGIAGTIFMPVTTPMQKVRKTEIFGSGNVTIELTGDTFDAALAAARAHCARTGSHFLSPFDDDDVIGGQGTVAAEIDAQSRARPDLVIVPVGGGGLSAGMLRHWGANAPPMRFVEPDTAASLAAALSAGGPVTLPTISSFVDGAAVARIGDRPFAVLRDVDPSGVMAVPEDRLCDTMVEMLDLEGIVLEPAGALSVDALRDLDVAGQRVVCVTTGGNFDFERLPEVKERAARWAGTKRYYLLRLPQRPGALRDFLELLGPHDDIARFEYLKKSARNFGTVLIGIESAAPEELDALAARVEAAGFLWRDITADRVLAELVV